MPVANIRIDWNNPPSFTDISGSTNYSNMPQIAFLDTEVQPKTGKILDIGAINNEGNILHSSSIPELKEFLKGTEYICGHNIIGHDLKYLRMVLGETFVSQFKFIDTLYMSPLLFPKKPYHKLLKDDKLQSEELNNPLSDAKKSKDLFHDEIDTFRKLDNNISNLYFNLLGNTEHYKYFFEFTNFSYTPLSLTEAIQQLFNGKICTNHELGKIIEYEPEALAYALALIGSENRNSITPPWVLNTFPAVEGIMFLLRSQSCVQGCNYCDISFDAKAGLKTYFGFDAFRSFQGEPLQEKAVNAALSNKSLLAVFPTGGGKSLTYQIPALMAGENAHALTVIISPLQSLMKDQVDNLEKKGITEGVTINGLLEPIERGKAVERVEDGSASILYISPESLRSKTIEKLLLSRNIARFVIDEAHCFSSWGHDFRVDYLYIGDFLKALQDKKGLTEPIPVSCFTATAKPQVIEDIKTYFDEKLGKSLDLIKTTAARDNLHYKVINCNNDNEKYARLRELIDANECPTIVYVSRTRRAEKISEKLSNDGYAAKAFHGKMDVKDKTEHQNAFMNGDTDIMVATSAFGMGVDKNDVGMVVHFEISDSLENYIQESGRAGRDDAISAHCYILYNEDDLAKHFVMLNQTKINKNQIQEVWKAIKDLTKFRTQMSNSALEIARRAGWNEQIDDIETRVTTAIAALEEAGYVKRTHNSPRIYATSILVKNADEAIQRINQSVKFNEKQKQQSIRIIKKLISSKSRFQANDEVAESRVDYISDHLGIKNKEVILCLTLMREERILADTKDLSAYINPATSQNNSQNKLQTHAKLETFLLDQMSEQDADLNIKEINESAENSGITSNPNRIITVINFWAINNWIKKKSRKSSTDNLSISLKIQKEKLEEQFGHRHVLASFIIDYLFEKSKEQKRDYSENSEDVLIEFSVHELKEAYEKSEALFKHKISVFEVEEALFFLSRIESLRIDGGFLVVHNKMTVDRIETNPRRQYKVEDYESLRTHYQNKTQQIHIVGEYAKQMISDYKGALTFVDDYFQLNYSSFLNKYFPKSRQDEIVRNITPAKFKKLFGDLSPRQLDIIKDKVSKYIVVAAGPGSGKTRLLVHKLASIIYMEDVKYEQLLMLTFSRAAVNEFKQRLIDLIGNAALYVEIKTFHSYCFDLLGRIGTIEKSQGVISEAIQKIQGSEVDPGRIAKAVLVIDEAQDMDSSEYELILSLMERNPDMRVIAVGDDDQNIYEFRGSDSKYFRNFLDRESAAKYELVENYRSKNNLVAFTNQFAETINHRIKEANIRAVENADGLIKITKYSTNELIEPLAGDIRHTELSGSTCVLARTNEEALYITGLLNKYKLRAKLIQSNSGFDLSNLQEIRFIKSILNSDTESRVISDGLLSEIKKELKEKFNGCPTLPVCNKIIKTFEALFPKTKYKSDFDVFIGESKVEDFVDEGNDVILVSTMHKAKGKEFDNIFLLLNQYELSDEASKRLLYVAMTRAKNNLAIHYNSDFLDHINTANLERFSDDIEYSSPEQIYIQLTHQDMHLGYFKYVQHRILKLKSGNRLMHTDEVCMNSQGEQVLKYSQSFIQQLENHKSKGYSVSAAYIHYIVYWFNRDTDEESAIILPHLTLTKSSE